MLIHRSIVKTLCKVVGPADTRYALNQVLVTPEGVAVATNGHILVEATHRQHMGEEADGQFPAAEGIPTTIPSKPVLIPPEALEAAVKALPRGKNGCGIPILKCMAVREENGKPVLLATDLERWFRQPVKYEGEDGAKFPAYENIRPKAEAKPLVLRVGLSAAYLKIIAEAALEKEATTHLVVFEFRRDPPEKGAEQQFEGPVVWKTGDKAGGRRLAGVLMPMALD
jgi:hypothetical protein